MPILRGPDSILTKNLTETEKNLGVDLKINQNGDLELNNFNDFKLIAGVQNAAQAVFLKLNIEPKGLLYHPEIGTDLRIGEKITDAFSIKTQILKSLNQDERFENIDTNVKILGSTVLVDLRVSIVNTGIQVPLQFVTLNG